MPDGTLVVISGGDGTVRVWRLADGMPLVHVLDLSKDLFGVAVHCNATIVTGAGIDIAIHQPADMH